MIVDKELKEVYEIAEILQGEIRMLCVTDCIDELETIAQHAHIYIERLQEAKAYYLEKDM